jgi:hypothetical protein
VVYGGSLDSDKNWIDLFVNFPRIEGISRDSLLSPSRLVA